MKLLHRARGATAIELMAATNWQAHSVRAFLSGLRKKGHTVVREARRNGDLAYRLDAAPSVDTAPRVEPLAPAVLPADASVA